MDHRWQSTITLLRYRVDELLYSSTLGNYRLILVARHATAFIAIIFLP